MDKDKRSNISLAVIHRLPRYYRYLCDLENARVLRVSSRELSDKMGFTASQIRQDLNCFGGFGQQGYGYNVEQLKLEIANILGLNSPKKTIIIGAGNMTKTLINNNDFDRQGFKIIGIFDKSLSLAGHIIKGFPIRHIDTLDEFCKENFPEIAVLCIPKNDSLIVAQQLIHLGIKGFWNFTRHDLSLHFPGIPVENVHLGDSLMTLCYKVTKNHN